MGLVSRQAIARAVDVTFEDIEVPEWRDDDGNQTVRVRSLSAKERDAFESTLVVGEGAKRRPNMANIRAKLVAACMVDETGARVYPDQSAGAEELSGKNAAAMDRVFTVCQKLSGLSAADVADLAKNSEPDLNDSLRSTSAQS
jgi:hypothetical protein